jgi:type III secretory pathway component EscV
MKSIKSSSIFTSNNSIPLIIFVFIFIGVGMFFLIQKTTEKQQNKQDRQNSNSDDDSSSGVNLEQKIIKDSRNMPNQMNNNNTSSNNQGNAQFLDNMSSPFSDEVGLFIKKDETNSGNGGNGNSNNKVNINKYATSQHYIPPFGSGKETRCMERQVKRPNTTNDVSSTANSLLVKNSSNASY